MSYVRDNTSFEQSKASVKRTDGPRWISATFCQIYRQQFVFCYIMKSNHCLKKESHPPHTYPSIKTTFQNTNCNRTQRCPNEKKNPNKKQIRTILMFDITAQAQPRIYSLSILYQFSWHLVGTPLLDHGLASLLGYLSLTIA